MSRPNKRKHDETELREAMDFVYEWARNHGLPAQPGFSKAEQVCAERASRAREQFKIRRSACAAAAAANANTSSPNGNVTGQSSHSGIIDSLSHVASTSFIERPGDHRRGLSPAQKYNIRLRNNRKSAHAAKVYQEIFRREISHCLQQMTEQPNQQGRQSSTLSLPEEVEGPLARSGPAQPSQRELELEAQNVALRKENDQLISTVRIYKIRCEKRENTSQDDVGKRSPSSVHELPQTPVPISSMQLAPHVTTSRSQILSQNPFVNTQMLPQYLTSDSPDHDGHPRGAFLHHVQSSSAPAPGAFIVPHPNQPDGPSFRPSLSSNDDIHFDTNDLFPPSQPTTNHPKSSPNH